MRVDFDRYSVRIDGVRRLIRAGALHYFRLPSPELWRDRLAKMREAGLNAVDLYYPWSYHSRARGEYDFADLRDIDLLHDMIEQAGLYLIARPGPYICAEIDFGGLPAWLLRDPAILPRCRAAGEFVYSLDYMHAVREWFAEIVPRFAGRPNLLLVQIENEYAVPPPFGEIPRDLFDLALRWLDMRTLRRLGAWLAPRRTGRPKQVQGQHNPYMRELYQLARERGVRVPIFHNDIWPWQRRQLDVDLLALDRYPIIEFERDWRDDPHTFDVFRGDEQALDAHRSGNPMFYAELQAGWFDPWGGPGYGRVRARLGPDGMDNTAKAALAERATLLNYFAFCGGVTWGYMSSPDVYTSYDYGAPVAETGALDARYETLRRLHEFLERFEEDLCATDADPGDRWCPEHVQTRRSAARRFVFLRNPSRTPRELPTPESERSELAPWETQIRVYRSDGTLEAVSPEPVRWVEPPPPLPPMLPRLERWSFCSVAPQLDPGFDDSAWTALDREQVERGQIDIDSLGLHYGFVWYRGTFRGRLDRLLLDARHCYAVWLNGQLIGSGDQHRNSFGLGPDGARRARIPLRGARLNEGRNVLAILVESLGHNKGFADDSANPRGLVSIDTGATQIAWRCRGGLVRGERGMTPRVAFEAVDRTGGEEVVLPHGWTGEPAGLGLYETEFELAGVDPKRVALSLGLDPGRGKANLYLNGYLVGRYWPERGPQSRFLLPWGLLRADGENRLAIVLWKRSERASLGKVRLIAT